MDPKTEESRIHYNKKAKDYENSYEGRFTIPYNQYICDHLVLKGGETVLDVACGNGRLLRMLSQKSEIKAYGIDISEEMIKMAALENKNMDFILCAADHTPFEDNSFDLVTVCCAFHHFADPGSFMKEASRILKPGGKLLIAEPGLPAILRWLENIIMPLFRSGDVKVHSKEQLVVFLENEGFERISSVKDNMRLFVEGYKK